MNDRFRFRAWNKEEKKMYYDAQDTYDYMAGKPIIFAESFSCLLTNDEEWEVEQCTGLKDKNGNLIYEGDLIKVSPKVSDKIMIVVFNEYCFECFDKDTNEYILSLSVVNTVARSENIEIIGNIHEQPEQGETK